MAGNGGVGKTTFLDKLITNNFKENMDLTIGVDIYLYELKLGEIPYVLQFWDLGGQERFRFIQGTFMKGAKAVLLFYDLSRPETLMNIEEWIQLCRIFNKNLPILLVGSKLDRYDSKLDNVDMEAILFNYQLIDHVKISSKQKVGFEKLLEVIYNQIIKNIDVSSKIGVTFSSN